MSVVVTNAKQQIKNIIFTAANKAINDGVFEQAELRDFTIEVPKDRANGDYAVNAAMVWSRLFKKAPRQIHRYFYVVVSKSFILCAVKDFKKR